MEVEDTSKSMYTQGDSMSSYKDHKGKEKGKENQKSRKHGETLTQALRWQPITSKMRSIPEKVHSLEESSLGCAKFGA